MCGLSRSHIKRIIKNDIPIERLMIDTAEAIAKALGLSLNELILIGIANTKVQK